MPEARKHCVVIASVLKPVDDIRNFQKLGRTIAASGRYEVHMIGTGDATADVPEVQFHSLGNFERISWRRWTASFRVFAMIRKLKPDIFVITTHELLAVAMLTRMILGTRIVYDVQENYYLNILYGNAFPRVLKWPLALFVRIKEMTCAHFVDLFILAEKVYEPQLKFVRKNSIILENKAILPAGFRRSPIQGLDLLFSGTLAESTGVFEAIRIASLLHKIDSSIRLLIIGFAPDSKVRTRLAEEVTGRSFITLRTSSEALPHKLIIEAISTAHFGIVCYPESPHTSGAIPTKAYEYLACGLPVLTTPLWSPLFDPYNASIIFDKSTSAPELLRKMKSGAFYTTKPASVLWEYERTRLLASMLRLIESNQGQL